MAKVTKKYTCEDLQKEGFVKYAGPGWCCCECINAEKGNCEKEIKIPNTEWGAVVCCSVWKDLYPKEWYESLQEQLNA